VKLLLKIFFLLTLPVSGFSQYYLRGELKDENGNGLAGARISLFSKGNYPYYSGSSGAFGIPTKLRFDTITFSLPGYDTLKTVVVATEYAYFTLKAINRKPSATTLHLSSFTKNLNPGVERHMTEEGETYSSTIENQFVNTVSYPETGFALHVDKASYSNIRRFLNLKEKPPADAVRIEEMLNYFNFKKAALVDQERTFSFTSNVTTCPWNPASRLLFINLQAKKINLDKTPAANLVFLIDVSGSMDMPNRLPLIKNAFKLLTENLRSKDIVTIVTYGDEVRLLLPATAGDNKQKILAAIEGLIPGGATPGESAIRAAYSVARENFIINGNNRVILATDGDFNVGQSSEKELEDIISRESKTGVYLTCLGVGIGNYKDSKLEALAKKGNGNFAYLDNEKEAEKVLVEEYAQTLYSVANNVYLNLQFNSSLVKEYRLIGFDNKKSAVADKNTELEGGEIGSGHSMIAAFEIVPVDTGISLGTKAVATVLLSYKIPGHSETIKETFKAEQNFLHLDRSDSTLRFAASVIMFGTLLKESEFSKKFTWDELQDFAKSSTNPDNLLQKEFVDLVAKARKLYGSGKRKKP
jgi:Ca-activated chloride channel family protein